MTSIWFKLAHMLLENVFPEGGTTAADDTVGSVSTGVGLFRTGSSSKAVSSKASLGKPTRAD